MRENSRVKIEGDAMKIASLIALTAEQWPEKVEPIPDLYVSPKNYRLAKKAIKENELGFYMKEKELYFRGFRIVKYNPPKF